MRRLTHQAWTWARTVLEGADSAPPVFLGYGDGDRFADAHAMLAEDMPATRVRTCRGGHDWIAWIALFAELAPAALREAAAVDGQEAPQR